MLADLIKTTIVFVISNYSLSFFLLGLIVSLVAIVRSANRIDRAVVIEKLLAWYVFFSIGIDNFYNFCHARLLRQDVRCLHRLGR